MKMYAFYLVLVFNGICSGCQGDIKYEENKCKEAYKEANIRLNRFYQKAEHKELDTALYIVEKNFNACPDYNVRMVNLKVRILILLKAYDRGYKFVDSLDEEKFDKAYKKSFYLRSFRAMELESRGDSVNRNKQYLEITGDVLEYIKQHPSDKEAIADLIFVKAKVEEKSKVLESIYIMQRQSNGSDSMFYEGLKSAILGNEIMTPAVRR